MINNERKLYTSEATEEALKLIGAIRPTFRLHSNMLNGMRFNDDAYVLSVLETTSEQWEFEDFPTTTVGFALEQAARVDYWYENEKNYGTQDYNPYAYEREGEENPSDDE